VGLDFLTPGSKSGTLRQAGGSDVDSISLAEASKALEDLAGIVLQQSPTPVAHGALWPRSGAPASETPSQNMDAKYRALVEQIPAVIFMAYLDKGIGEAYVSPQIEASLGFSQAEWLEDPVRWYRQRVPQRPHDRSLRRPGSVPTN